MVWSTTDWTPGDYQHYANELWEALNERRAVLGLDPWDVPAAGAILQDCQNSAPEGPTGAFSLAFMQNQIADLCGYFVESHTGLGVKRDNFHGETAIPVWDLTSLFVSIAAGVGEGRHFRKATTWPTDWEDWADPAYSYGFAEEGDILGPWVIKDVQDALNRLVWTKYKYTFSREGENSRKYGPARRATWDLAKSAAESAFDASAIAGDGPLAWALGGQAGDDFDAALNRVYAYGQITSYPDYAYASEADWYAWSEVDSGWSPRVSTYDANGENLVENAYGLWATTTQGANTSSVTTGTRLGDASARPAWCDSPGVNGTYRGYWVPWSGYEYNVILVVRWEAGGFTYY